MKTRPCPRCGRPTVCRHCLYERPGSCPTGVLAVRAHEDTGLVICASPAQTETDDLLDAYFGL